MSTVKRTVDLVASSIGIIVSIPILFVCAVAIKVESSGPIFFLQTRVGRHGRAFKIIKFRSMFHGAGQGLMITATGDPRITRVGRWLRATKLDELPQLFNVLRGHMSLVGPRPEVPEYVASYSAVQKQILEFTPGITGPASLGYIQEEKLLEGNPNPDQFYRQHIMPTKLELDLQYFTKATVMDDIGLLVLTIGKLFLPLAKAVSIRIAM